MPPQIHEGAVISVSFLSFAFVALYDEINSVSFLFPATVALYDRIIIGETPLRPHYMQVLSFCQMEKYYKIRFIALGLGLGHLIFQQALFFQHTQRSTCPRPCRGIAQYHREEQGAHSS